MLFVFLLGIFPLFDGDIWLHLRTGQLIWQRGEIPRHDWYTYTNPDVKWIDLHWGFQLFVATLWSLGGSALLILVKSIVGAATIAICLTVGRRDWPKWQTVGVWLAPVLIFAGRYYVRPEMFTLLFLACTLAILHHARQRPWLFWLLPLLQVAWVNVQGLFVLQFVVMGCFLLEFAIQGERLCRTPKGANPVPLPWKSCLVSFGLTLLASLINPYGIRGALLPFTLYQQLQGSQRELFTQLSEELLGIDDIIRQYGVGAVFTDFVGSMQVLVFVAGLVTFVLLLSSRRFSLYRLLIFVAFAYLAWQGIRNCMLFAIVGGSVLRLNLEELIESREALHRSAKKDDRKRSEFFPRSSRWRPVLIAVCLALLILSVPTNILHKIRQSEKRFGVGHVQSYAHDAAKLLRRPGMPNYVYATDGATAAITIFHLAPEKRVFFDARLEVHKPQTLMRYSQIKRQLASGDPRGEENLSRGIPPSPNGRRELPALVIDNNTLLYHSLSEPRLLQGLLHNARWQCVFSEPNANQDGGDPQSLMLGATVFLAKERAEALGLPVVKPVSLEHLTDLWQDGGQ